MPLPLSSKQTNTFHALQFVIALFIIFILLVIPNRISWMNAQSFVFLPLELMLLGLVLLVPGRTGKWLKAVAATLLAAGVIFKIADIAAYQVFARPFNPVFDLYLLADGMNLLTGAIGRIGAWFVAALLIAVTVGIVALSFVLLRTLQTGLKTHHHKARVILPIALLGWFLLPLAGWHRASHAFYDNLSEHFTSTLNSIADIKSFRTAVNIDSYAATPAGKLFEKLAGKDVMVIFLESYGRVVLDDPAFASHVKPVLEQGSAELEANGLHVRSTFLTSPTVGGISWLAHGTLLSGLWIDSQVRYDSLMMSERPSFNRLFKNAGWRTVAVMPAISMDWPEGDYFGYDQVYGARDLGYQGKPFNWVTMPDQYVLSSFQAIERKDETRAPVMAELALISSHAPWTPVPFMVPWQAVGDGSIFNEQASAGDSPEVIWQDPERIKEQYRKSIEYAVANLVSYAINYGDDNLVMLIIGDHQPAPLVTGDLTNHDVPVHLIARDPAVMAAIEDWQWSDGLIPAQDAPVWRMDELRNRFIAAFSLTSPVAVSALIPLEQNQTVEEEVGSASISR
ncbi:MAG: hypothetical protein V4628_10920 [Pseudomonadota bacterium]